MEVGEYIRFGYGEIGIVKYYDDINIGIITRYGETEISSGVDKMAKNIKDLVEENDYVNGNKVVSINGELYVTDEGVLSDIEIKSIVTKEQFNSVMYKVGED